MARRSSGDAPDAWSCPEEEAELVQVRGEPVLQLLHPGGCAVPVRPQVGLLRGARAGQESEEREGAGDGDLQEKGGEDPDEKLCPQAHGRGLPPARAYFLLRRVATSKMTAAASTAPRTMYWNEMSVPIRFMPLVRDM